MRKIYEIERRRRRQRAMEFCEIAACAVLFLMMLYFFDFVEVFTESSGSFNRFVVFSASVCGVILILCKLPLGLRVLRSAWPWLLVVTWLAMTTWWAGYPELSRTRVLAFAMIYLAALGIAVGFRSPPTVTATLVAAFGVVIFANLLSLGLPDSYTEIGFRGIHKHKNAAGFLASVAGVVIGFALPQIRSFSVRIVAVCLVFASVVLLIMTTSKTSLILVAVAICLVPIYILWVRHEGPRFHYLIMTAMACTFIFVAGASGTKISGLGGVLFGDPTLTNRMAIWAAVQDMIAQSPWRGYGFGSIWDVGEEWNSLPGGEGYVFYNDAELINEAHNGYLDLILNGGRIALVLCWLVTLRALWFSLILATSNSLPRSCRWTFCMLHCLLAILLVHNMTESSVFFPGSHYTYFFLVLIAQIERWKVEFDAHREAWHRANADVAWGTRPRHATALAAVPARVTVHR